MAILVELFDIALMTAFLGFLFKDAFPVHQDPDALISGKRDYAGFWLATKIIALPIILHELAHKFVAMAFGLSATFHAFYADPMTLGLGVLAIISKLANFGLIFIVPGYVEIHGAGTPAADFRVSFAGPAMHLLFWLCAAAYLRWGKRLGARRTMLLTFTSRINMFLFIFNMLPIPPFDGAHVIGGLLNLF